MQRTLAVAVALALVGCKDEYPTESSVFDCYCTREIDSALNQALDIATVQDQQVEADVHTWASAEIDRRIYDRVEPMFNWCDYRLTELERRVAELETSAGGSSPGP